MLRFDRLLVPAAALAAGTLLSACAVTGVSLGGASGDDAPAVTSTDGPNGVGGRGEVLGGPITAVAAPPEQQIAPAPTVTPTTAVTPQTWADLLASGAVTTTAAAPGLVASATAVPHARNARPTAPKPARAASTAKVVYLTFDDGPSAVYTKRVLSLLAKHHAHATFFVIGKQAAHAPATLRAERRNGHVIGNHTWDHRSLAGTSWSTFRREVGRVQRVVKSETGVAPLCLRPPGGAMDKRTTKRAARLGLRVRLWSIDTRDWANPPSKVLAARVVNHVRPGSVVLMHDGGGNRTHTVRALKVILAKLEARGYVFKSLCG